MNKKKGPPHDQKHVVTKHDDFPITFSIRFYNSLYYRTSRDPALIKGGFCLILFCFTSANHSSTFQSVLEQSILMQLSRTQLLDHVLERRPHVMGKVQVGLEQMWRTWTCVVSSSTTTMTGHLSSTGSLLSDTDTHAPSHTHRHIDRHTHRYTCTLPHTQTHRQTDRHTQIHMHPPSHTDT